MKWRRGPDLARAVVWRPWSRQS